MAKLPSKAVLGDVAIPSAFQPSRIDLREMQAIGAAGEAMHRGLASIGAGIASIGGKIGKEFEQAEQGDAQLEMARAKSHLTTGDIELRSRLEEDKDYTTLGRRYEEGRAKLESEAAGMIRDPRRRELFQLGVADDGARGRAAVRSTARSLEDNAVRADAEQRINYNMELLGSGKVTDPAERARIIQDTQGIISGLKPRIGELEAGRLGKAVAEKLGEAFEKTLPREEALELLKRYMPPEKDSRAAAQNPRAAIADRIIGVESGGDPTAKNPNSSATGAGQFIGSTWLGIIKEKRPDLAAGKTDAQILALRTDPKLSREMVEAYRQQNTERLTKSGIEATPGAQYLAHFLGPDGAIAVLKANPSAAVSSFVDSGAVSANRSILSGKTAGQVVAWADRKMAGALDVQTPEPVKTGTPLDFVSQQKRMEMYERAQGDVLRKRSAESVLLYDQMHSDIIDAKANRKSLMPREAIENAPLLADKKNALKVEWDAAAGNIVKFQNFATKWQDPNGGSINRYDKDEKGFTDQMYKALGGDNPDPKVRSIALSAAIDRAGFVPDSAALKLRSGLVSTNPMEVQDTLQTITRVQQRNPNAFTGVAGADDFEKAAIAYDHRVNFRGMTAEQAVQKYIAEQTPQYKAEEKARLKGEDVDKLLKDKVSANDLENAFDDSWFSRDPKSGTSVRDRERITETYKEIVRERYLDSPGDIDLAKKQAQAELKKTHGVTMVNGKKTIVPYAPESSPGFAGLPNASDVIAKDAIDTIKAANGTTVDRSQLRIVPMPDGSTVAAYKAGRATPYLVTYYDQNGVLQTLNPGKGKAFVPDASVARAAQTEERRVELEDARTAEERMQSNPLSPRSIRRAIGLEGVPSADNPPMTPDRQSAIDSRNKEKSAARERLILEGTIVPDKSRMKSGGLTLPDANN